MKGSGGGRSGHGGDWTGPSGAREGPPLAHGHSRPRATLPGVPALGEDGVPHPGVPPTPALGVGQGHRAGGHTHSPVGSTKALSFLSAV